MTAPVTAVTADAPADWDDYVVRHPQGTAYPLAKAVSIGREAFGLPVHYVQASRDGRLVGVLPLVEQQSRLFGHYLVSLPFFTYGGLLSDDDASTAALLAAAKALGDKQGVDHVELRHTQALPQCAWPERLDKVSLVLPLPSDEAQLAKALGSKLRSQIRRAERENPDVEWGGEALLPEFYAVFARAMRDLGTPVYPRSFFVAVCRALGDNAQVLVVRVQGKAQSVALIVRHGASIEVPWAASTPTGKQCALNMRLYWELLRHAVAAGAASFDFGRSSVDSGTYRFKQQWGAQPLQLHWHYGLPTGQPLPQLNQSNPKYALAASLWRRLPLWCANALGPLLIRNLP